MKSGRAEQLQFLRFLAFIHVFILHTESWQFYRYPAWNGGLSAVSFFIMLGGAVVGYSGWRKEITLSGSAVAKDMVKRIRKIYPLYFLTTCLAICFSEIPTAVLSHDRMALMQPAKQLLRNLLLLQSWFDNGYFKFNGVGWYLSTTMFLALFNLPILVLLKRMEKQERPWLWYGGLLLAGGAFTAVYSVLTYAGDVHFLQYIFPPARLGQHLIGITLGFALRSVQERIPEKTGLFTLAEAGALVFWVGSLYLFAESWHNRVADWVLPNALLIAAFLPGKGALSRVFRWKPLVRLGDVSFECFLVHMFLILSYGALIEVQPVTDLGKLFSSLLCFFLTVLLSLQLNGAGKKA